MICSAHSWTLHTAGAGLNVHCASLMPEMLDRNAFFDISICSIRKARSALFRAPPSAAIAGTTARTEIARTESTTCFRINSLLLNWPRMYYVGHHHSVL